MSSVKIGGKMSDMFGSAYVKVEPLESGNEFLASDQILVDTRPMNLEALRELEKSFR